MLLLWKIAKLYQNEAYRKELFFVKSCTYAKDCCEKAFFVPEISSQFGIALA